MGCPKYAIALAGRYRGRIGGFRPGQRVGITLELGRRVIEGMGLRFTRVPVSGRLWLATRLGSVRR